MVISLDCGLRLETGLPWVAPTIAAEIWGVSIEQVLAGVASGSIPSRMDGNFLFVNTDPIPQEEARLVARETDSSLQAAPGDGETGGPIVTAQEMEALGVTNSRGGGSGRESEPPDLSDWRNVRERTGQIRRPPAGAKGRV